MELDKEMATVDRLQPGLPTLSGVDRVPEDGESRVIRWLGGVQTLGGPLGRVGGLGYIGRLRLVGRLCRVRSLRDIRSLRCK